MYEGERLKVMSSWYYMEKNKSHGPFSKKKIIEHIKSGHLGPFDLVYFEGEKNWKSIIECKEFHSLLGKHSLFHKKEWILLIQNKEKGIFSMNGPFSRDEATQRIQSGEVHYTDYAWKAGMTKWYRISHLKEFNAQEKKRIQFPKSSPSFSIPFPEDVIQIKDIMVQKRSQKREKTENSLPPELLKEVKEKDLIQRQKNEAQDDDFSPVDLKFKKPEDTSIKNDKPFSLKASSSLSSHRSFKSIYVEKEENAFLPHLSRLSISFLKTFYSLFFFLASHLYFFLKSLLSYLFLKSKKLIQKRLSQEKLSQEKKSIPHHEPHHETRKMAHEIHQKKFTLQTLKDSIKNINVPIFLLSSVLILSIFSLIYTLLFSPTEITQKKELASIFENSNESIPSLSGDVIPLPNESSPLKDSPKNKQALKNEQNELQEKKEEITPDPLLAPNRPSLSPDYTISIQNKRGLIPRIIIASKTEAPLKKVILTLHGEAGKVTKNKSIYRQFYYSNLPIINLDLKSLRLGSGHYVLGVTSGKKKKVKHFFLGSKKGLNKNLRKMRKSIFFLYQNERFRIFRLSQKLEKATSRFIREILKKRKSKERQAHFFTRWLKEYNSTSYPEVKQIRWETTSHFVYPKMWMNLKTLRESLYFNAKQILHAKNKNEKRELSRQIKSIHADIKSIHSQSKRLSLWI